MADIVNLNQFRKSRQRAEKADKAAENRVHFGRTKGQRALDESEIAAAERSLNRKKLDHAAKAGEDTGSTEPETDPATGPKSGGKS